MEKYHVMMKSAGEEINKAVAVDCISTPPPLLLVIVGGAPQKKINKK